MRHFYFSIVIFLLSHFSVLAQIPAPGCQAVPPACVTDQGAYDQVIANDPFCCASAWDTPCQSAYEALSSSCAAPAGPGQTCGDPISLNCVQTVTGNTAGVSNDNATSGAGVCGAGGSGGQNWYLLNPGALTTEVTLSTCGSSFDTRILVFTGTCGALTCVGNNDDFCGLQSQLTFNAAANTDYLISITGFGMGEGAYTLTTSIGVFLPPCVIYGSEAFFSVTTEDPYCCEVAWDSDCQTAYLALSDSCNLEGCMDTEACNYLPMAGIEDGSCTYTVKLLVYYEFNQVAGYQPQFDAAVANHPVLVTGTGEVVFSDADGMVTLTTLENTGVEVSLLAGGIYEPGAGTENVMVMPDCSNATALGLTNPNQELALTAGQNLAPIGSAVHCTLTNTQTVWLVNTGTTVLNGTLTMTFQEVMTASAADGGVAPSSIGAGVVVWDVVNQLPGSTVHYKVDYTGPGIAFLGETLTFELAMAFEESGAVVYENTIDYEMPVICAYDPNDKQAEPEGYAEPHFIHADTDIEYKIRFQNTGNFVAYDVTVHDALDVSKLDISTFVPVASSHSMMTCVQPSGVVDFIFNDIMLPDSTSDEPGSHGWLVFRIRPLVNLAAGSVIENTAHIYFDANPAIVTNTTWHTIIDCVGLAAFESGDLTICAGAEVEFLSSLPYIETYAWTVDGTAAGNGPELSWAADEGTYEVGLMVGNPLCEESEMVTVTVNPAPDAVIIADGVVLSAGSGAEWQWFLNGVAIPDATGQSFVPLDQGLYTVLVTNEFGCSDMSVGVLVTSVGEHAKMNLLLYPNPMTDRATLVLGAGMWTVDVYDAAGRKVRGYERVTDRVEIMKNELAVGVYSLLVHSNTGAMSEVRLVVE